MEIKNYRYDGEKKFCAKKFETRDTGEFTEKAQGTEKLAENLVRMEELQDRLYAENKEALLIIFQAMDAAGKDGAVKHVMSGMNPQGIIVHNFKQPTSEELSHDYLWRAMRVLPGRGNIAIFNRSYYEDVLVVKVRKLYEHSHLPERCLKGDLFGRRYRQIREFEQYLHENGIRVVKFFLNISKEEQKKRFLERIDDKEKNWKFSDSDIRERAYWEEYQKAYEDAINATGTDYAPWYVIPADKKWFARLLISEIIIDVLEDMDPKYPKLPAEKEAMLQQCRDQLLNEPTE